MEEESNVNVTNEPVEIICMLSQNESNGERQDHTNTLLKLIADMIKEQNRAMIKNSDEIKAAIEKQGELLGNEIKSIRQELNEFKGKTDNEFGQLKEVVSKNKTECVERVSTLVNYKDRLEEKQQEAGNQCKELREQIKVGDDKLNKYISKSSIEINVISDRVEADYNRIIKLEEDVEQLSRRLEDKELECDNLRLRVVELEDRLSKEETVNLEIRAIKDRLNQLERDKQTEHNEKNMCRNDDSEIRQVAKETIVDRRVAENSQLDIKINERPAVTSNNAELYLVDFNPDNSICHPMTFIKFAKKFSQISSDQ